MFFGDYSAHAKKFLDSLTDDFEPAWAYLLHRSPLPTLYSAVAELISSET